MTIVCLPAMRLWGRDLLIAESPAPGHGLTPPQLTSHSLAGTKREEGLISS